jgi:outer membrane protein OmpA-like peptidoglycan-associated protein
MNLILRLLVLASTALPEGEYEIQKPRDNWQKPGEIKRPKGTWQTPGAIQVPKGIQAIRKQETACEERFVVLADALFGFNEASLSPDAEKTLMALGPMLTGKSSFYSVRVEGHTDSIGSEEYNKKLSEMRAQAVGNWLVKKGYIARATMKGLGEARPIAPNTKPDGSVILRDGKRTVALRLSSRPASHEALFLMPPFCQASPISSEPH